MNILEIRDLQVSFKMQKELLQAVRGISFTLKEKEILGIVGESGCGKSVSAKAIVQLLPQHSTLTSGEVIYAGENILDYNEKRIRKIRGKHIGMIFQDPMTSLNPTMKIGHQIYEGYHLHHNRQASFKEGWEYAIHLLDLVGISQASSRVHEYPHTLSGGMRQRAMIALALAAKPKLIIADEPTTALDATIQAQILELMHEIKEKTGTSFILITHDMSVVAGYCDRVLVMYAGKIVEQAPVSQIFKNPSHPYTKGLLQSIPRIDMPQDHPLIPIEGSPPSLLKEIKGCAFADRCNRCIPTCQLKSPSLEEIDKQHEVACWNP